MLGLGRRLESERMIPERTYPGFSGHQNHCAQHLYICGDQNASLGHVFEMHDLEMHGLKMHGSAGTITCCSECVSSTVVTSGSMHKRVRQLSLQAIRMSSLVHARGMCLQTRSLPMFKVLACWRTVEPLHFVHIRMDTKL